MLKRTPLFEDHQKLGGKLIEFGGWEMPVQYTSIVDEHQAVRQAAGLFDISHMGEVRASGPAAAEFLNHILTNDISRLTPGLGQYTLLCRPDGGVIDDLYAYRLGEQEYLLIINASRIEADIAWVREQHSLFPRSGEVELENLSDRTAAVAVQGPKTIDFINVVFPGPSSAGQPVQHVTDLKKNEVGSFEFNSVPVWVSRTGYTGEDGFEVVAPNESIGPIWRALLAAGAASGLKPAGLGARDTLRTEACFPLYGHELDEKTTPIEAGVGFFVTIDKPDFIGRAALARQKQNGPAKKCIAFKMTEKSPPPRPGYSLWSAEPESRLIGQVVSGTQSPTFNVGLGLGYVPPEFAAPETLILVEIRGRKFPAVVVKKPFLPRTRPM